MSNHQHVRVHLKRAIMVGHGNEARYVKVVCGIRQYDLDQRLSSGEALVAVDVFGFVTLVARAIRVESVEPHTHLLAGSNILSIEDLALASDVHFESCPPKESGCRRPMQERPAQNQACAGRWPHAAHSYHNPRAMIECPGFPSN